MALSMSQAALDAGMVEVAVGTLGMFMWNVDRERKAVALKETKAGRMERVYGL